MRCPSRTRCRTQPIIGTLAPPRRSHRHPSSLRTARRSSVLEEANSPTHYHSKSGQNYVRGTTNTGAPYTAYLYAANQPIDFLDPNGRNAKVNSRRLAQPELPRDRGCERHEMDCINKAKALAISFLATHSSRFDFTLKKCQDPLAKNCTTQSLTQCLIDTLNNTRYLCNSPFTDRVCDGNWGYTRDTCVDKKDAGAANRCRAAEPSANDCALCPDSRRNGLTVVLRHMPNTYDRGRLYDIGEFCKLWDGHTIDLGRTYITFKELVMTLVHEAAHSCVGGHSPNNLPPIIPGIPQTHQSRCNTIVACCDACCRPDAWAVEHAFATCGGLRDARP
jgi:hypothetical protein